MALILLFLLISLSYSVKPALTLFQIRIFLLVLIALLTILAVIMTTISAIEGPDARKLPLFLLFADIDIVIVFLMTFLPAFRRLKTRLV